MVEVAVDGLPCSVNVVVGETKLPTGLLDNGGDDRVVTLVDPREQVVAGLVVQSSCEQSPEPTVCGVVLCGGHLHLCPGGVIRDNCTLGPMGATYAQFIYDAKYHAHPYKNILRKYYA